MGYYTKITDSNFTIPAENLDAAYQAMCKLNWNNKIKSGGIRPGNPDADDSAPRDDKWFSWMDWNYHETCRNSKEILEALGFEVDFNDQGDLYVVSYDSKSGNEEHFIKALAPYATGYICWVGEDGCQYKWEIEDGEFVSYTGEIEWRRD